MTDDDRKRRKLITLPVGLDVEQLEGFVERMAEKLDQLHADLSASNLGVRLEGAAVTQVGGPNGRVRVQASAGTLLGFSLREVTGAAPARVYLRDGGDAAGGLLVPVSLSADESSWGWLGPGGISFGAGLFVHVESGQVEGAVFTGAVS